MKSSATTAPRAFQFAALLGNDASDVERPGPASRLTFIPAPTHDFEVAFPQVATRLPQAQRITNDLAGRGVFADLDGAAYRISHRCRQGDAQTLDLGHCRSSERQPCRTPHDLARIITS